MEDMFGFADDLGPAKIIHVHEPVAGVKGVLVVDNVAAGPSIGGVRMALDVTTAECFRLARAMTMKSAAAGLPHGGGKAVLVGDPKMPREDKERLLRGFAHALRNETDYIFAPDMGTDETCMAWLLDEIGRVVGLPREVGGIPLDEIGATGFGLAHAAEIAADHIGLSLKGARVAVQGLGAVGIHAARNLAAKGAVLVAAADASGAIHDPDGLDLDALIALKKGGGEVRDHGKGSKLGRDDIVGVDCDIWIPAARPDVLREDNIADVKAKLVIQGANIPATPGAERYLHERGVLCVPDFIANAGGVICAAMEYQGAGEAAAFQAIEEKLRRNTAEVLDRAKRDAVAPRVAAEAMARERVERAMSFKRWSIV